MTTRREFLNLVFDLVRGAQAQSADVSEGDKTVPEGFDVFLLRLRSEAMQIAQDLGVPDVAFVAKQNCYVDIYNQLITQHSEDEILNFLRRVYRLKGLNAAHIVDVYRRLHFMPTPSTEPLAQMAGELSKAVGIQISPQVRPGDPSDAPRGLVDVTAQLDAARSTAVNSGREPILMHLWHATSQIATRKLVHLLASLGLYETPRDTSNFTSFHASREAFVRTYNQAKRLIWLGVSDAALTSQGGVPGGRAALELIASGVVPLNDDHSGAELVSLSGLKDRSAG